MQNNAIKEAPQTPQKGALLMWRLMDRWKQDQKFRDEADFVIVRFLLSWRRHLFRAASPTYPDTYPDRNSIVRSNIPGQSASAPVLQVTVISDVVLPSATELMEACNRCADHR